MLSWRTWVNGVRVERVVVKIDSRLVCAVVIAFSGVVIGVDGDSGRGTSGIQLSG